MEVGAGTFHPATTLRSLGENHWAAVMSSRPEDGDGRHGENPNRLQILSISGHQETQSRGFQEPYLGSLTIEVVDDILMSFVEDDWKPDAGRGQLGWKHGATAKSQFTYFQQVGGHDCKPRLG